MSLEDKYYNTPLIKLYSKIENPNNYFIDIGASDGPGPIFPFLRDEDNYGLCVEGRDYLYEQLKNNINNNNVDIHMGFIYPHTINSIFKKYNVPAEPDILKIDIDGYDLDVLKNILEEYKPKIIIAEINEKIPPPIYFEVKYSETFNFDSSHFYGFSIQAGKEVIEPYGYTLVSILGGNNIICLRNDIFGNNTLDLNTIYKVGYAENKEVFEEFPWNNDVDIWYTIKDTDLLKEGIIHYYTQINLRGKPVSRDSFIIR